MTWSQPAYETVARLVAARTGLTFPPNRRDSAEAGIRRAMARAGITDPSHFAALLGRDDALDDLVGELTIGETYFFREPGQFEFIRREVLPDVRRRRGSEHVLRVWSAGCASGEEAYSLAILFRREGFGGHFRLLATDVSRAALARARQGVYGAWSLRGDGAAAARLYLKPAGKSFRLDSALRHDVTFAHLNLALPSYPSPGGDVWGLDLILCRNVLIYFDQETVAQVARRMVDSLAEGGWLITASCDPPLADQAPFETVAAPEGVFYRRPGVNGAWSEPAIQNAGFPGPSAAEEPALPAGDLVDVVCPLSPPIRHDQAGSNFLEKAGPSLRPGHHGDRPEDAAAAALHVRMLAGRDTTEAERVCAAAAIRQPLAAELHYLHALLLLDLGRDDEATWALRRVLYLDRTLAVAQMTLGAVLRRRGDQAGARRAYRNARDLCRARSADETVPLANGEGAGRLAEAAQTQLDLLDASAE